MDKYEFNIKVEKMKKAVDRKDYLTAAKLADSINWERSTNAKVLMMIAQIYEKQERYTEARNALTAVYNRVPVGKRIVYKLAELAIKCDDLDDALDLYHEYQELAPNDASKLVLAYKISTARGDDLEKRISILEAYRRRDFDERWAYELATLYQQAGRGADCVSICDEIILWFGVGPYVDRAMTLKVAYAPLTPEQEERRTHKDYYEQKLAEVAAQSSASVSISADVSAHESDLNPADETAAADDAAESEFPVDAPSVSPVVKEAELHMTMEQELAQAIQSTTDELTPEADTNEWVTDKPISVDRVGEDVDGQYTLFRTVAEENGDTEKSLEHTRTFSFGELLTKTRRLDSLRDLAELNNTLEPSSTDTTDEPAAAEVPDEVISEETPSSEAPAAVISDDTPAAKASTEESPDETPDAETPTEMISDEMPAAEVIPDDTEPREQHMIFCHALKLTSDTPAVAQIKEAFNQAHQVSGIPTAPIARVGIDKINRAGFTAALKKLQGRDLLLENAGALSQTVIDQLLEAVETPPCTAVILLADNDEGISALCQKAPALFPLSAEASGEDLAAENLIDEDLADEDPTDEHPTDEHPVDEDPTDEDSISESAQKHFEEAIKETVNTASLDPEEFSAYIHEYALENDCKFDSMAELALAARIDRMELSGTPMTKDSAAALVERAIDKAERWTFKSIFISRYDKEGYLIIKEAHIN